jgi:integrase
MKGDWREALIKNHTRYVNQHIKKLAKAIGIQIEIFSQRARYTFADHTRNADIPIDVRMSMMGQDNEKTHRIYLSTIPDAMTREAVNQALVSPKKKGNGKD